MNSKEPPHVRVRRAGEPGDLGWVVMAHGEVYAREFGWNSDFEALVARIVADYAADSADGRDAAWICEVDGQRAGCILCLAGERPGEARLRLLLVIPGTRGLRIGTRLVNQCLDFARAAKYERVTLWTNDILVGARRIYQAAGFVLVDENPHHSFGHALVGQNWTLELNS